MTVYRHGRDVRPASQRPVADRIMTFARARRGTGLDAFDLDQLQAAVRLDRAALTEALAKLVAHGRLVRDSGPLGLADRRRPDRWRAA